MISPEKTDTQLSDHLFFKIDLAYITKFGMKSFSIVIHNHVIKHMLQKHVLKIFHRELHQP